MNKFNIEAFYQYVQAVDKKLKMKRPKVLDIQFKNGIIGKRYKQWVLKSLETFYTCYLCNHFSEYDFQYYFLENLIKDESFIDNIKKWDSNKVQNITKELIEKEIKKDESKILSIAKASNVKNGEKFFEINNDGESLIYKFYTNNLISLHFLIKYANNFTENENQSEKHKKIVRIVKILKNITRRNIYEKN